MYVCMHVCREEYVLQGTVSAKGHCPLTYVSYANIVYVHMYVSVEWDRVPVWSVQK